VNRRDILLIGSRAAAVSGTAALLFRGLPALAQPARRTVFVGARPARVVDIHAHCVVPQLADAVPEADPPRAALPTLTLGPARLEVMNARGIDVQALSINQFWWYARNRDVARRIVSVHDETLAAWCRAHPDRFVALSSVALQYPDLAAEQLDYAVKTLGHRGASIGGDVNGEPPASEKFDPFWAKAEELDVPVFMHPNNAEHIVRPGGLGGRGDLPNIIGNPLETTVFLSNMIFEGTLDRFPKLKICAAHGGGFLPSYLGRSEAACGRAGAACKNRRSPREYFEEQIFVDSMVFSAEGLRHLVAETAPSQVVYGSDLPYAWPDTIDLIADSPWLDDADKIAILGGNLTRLLKLSGA
jgi:aminocarboxymuconate-semialdehyde decarboxylase